MDNYVVYHLHSDLSNGVTNVDSVTKYYQYIDRAKECGMKALAFAEHGNCFEWFHKKEKIEEAGLLYIHAAEVYLTRTLREKVRDNYHCVLLARNYEGFLELNRLMSKSFNRKDNHFYYVPRVSFDELFETTDNIIVTSACVGGVLGKGDEIAKEEFLTFMGNHAERCFLEIGHHRDMKQVVYNQALVDISARYGLRLIAGTDTHALNEEHERGRSILQKSKNIHFDGEENWDLKFKTYDQLISAYREQDAIPEENWMAAIENTNALMEMVEPFELDRGTKYPHIYSDPERTFYQKIKEAEVSHPYAQKNHPKDVLDAVIDSEFNVYKETKSIDFMLLQTYIREWERANGIESGYGRGSVSGSMVAYLLGITQMDSVRFGLNFFRFMNPSRVTNADIDTDYSGKDRDKIKEFLLRDKMGMQQIKSSEIITFNTIALKGAIRDVGRALGMDLTEVSDICKQCEEDVPGKLRAKYKELFEYVDIVNGTIVSIGTHPSGVLVSDLPIDETVGLCSISTSDYPVSELNMKELDALMYVKLDILGLDNIGVINDTCRMLGIERLTPDNTDLEDEEVWRSIRDDTTLIFQWESNSAQAYLKKFMSDKTVEMAKAHNPDFSYIKWFSFGNGLIRPGCASFRDDVAVGNIPITGFKELDDFLSVTSGRITMQEDIMRFLVLFCGYSDAESDTVRRGIAKKYGTEKFIDEIHDRFVKYSHDKYEVDTDTLEAIFPPIKQGILDATRYAFSWNHSDAYSCIGYVCGYLRYYYPYEFITAALNIFSDNSDKTAKIVKYAERRGIKVTMPKWGIAKSEYAFDKKAGVISKNLTSIKYMSAGLAEELYEVAHSQDFQRFVDVLYAIADVHIDARQLDILIKLDFFSDFGNQRELLRIAEMFRVHFKSGNAKQISKTKIAGTPLDEIVQKYARGVTKDGKEAKNYTLLDVPSILRETEDAIKAAHMEDLSDTIKVQNFADVMGYAGYVSGKKEDLRKLYVMDVYPLVRKKDGKQFGYSIITKSIGSGKEARFTVVNRVFNADPIHKGEVIYCVDWSRNSEYFRLEAYRKVV